MSKADEKEKVLNEINLVEVVTSRGISLTPQGNSHVGQCPFDPEGSHGFTVTANTFSCETCGISGDGVDLVARLEGVSAHHAREIIKEGAVTPSFGGEPAIKSTVRKLTPPIEMDADDQELLQQVVEYYHGTLKINPEALAYMKKRHLIHPDVIDHFKLGFANRTLGLRLPEKNRKAGKQIRSRLIKIGIYRNTGHEHFNGSLVIPISDEAGNVIQVYGRKITKRLRAGTDIHLYLPGSHLGIFNVEALQISKEIILCESLIDALTFWCADIRNVTSIIGKTFNEDLYQTIKTHKIERVLIAFDRDQEGDDLAKEVARVLGGDGISCFRILLPQGMDVNEFVNRNPDNAAHSLSELVRSAQYLTGPLTSVRSLNKSVDADAPEPSSAPSPDPPSPGINVQADLANTEIVITLGDRRWRVRGLGKNMSFETLKVNLMVSREASDLFHVDTLDFYSARHRINFIKAAATELQLDNQIVKKDLGKILLKLEDLQEEQIRAALQPKKVLIKISDEERDEAMELLEAPDLLDRILEDIDACGLVGERNNKAVAYLATISRKLPEPLAILVQSSTAAGKSALMNSVLAFVPEEERIAYSAMTGQSLYYMGEGELKHKILAIAEEEGAENASYALKLLQSEGELSIASTGKEANTGRLVTHEYRVEGPVMIFLTTTSIDIDEEMANRCIVLTVDEDRNQTRRIHESQRLRRTPQGLVARSARARLLKLHRNAQRLLRMLPVGNPYAKKLTFVDAQTRTRRDHEKYLSLIEAVTLLHQFQRPIKRVRARGEEVEYVETTVDDIILANRLASDVLGRTLDELQPQTRRFLELARKMVVSKCEDLDIDQEDYRFTRRELRQHTGWSMTQLRIHLRRLVEMEYVIQHRAGRGQSYLYELLWSGEGINGSRFVLGLIDPEQLDQLDSQVTG